MFLVVGSFVILFLEAPSAMASVGRALRGPYPEPTPDTATETARTSRVSSREDLTVLPLETLVRPVEAGTPMTGTPEILPSLAEN